MIKLSTNANIMFCFCFASKLKMLMDILCHLMKDEKTKTIIKTNSMAIKNNNDTSSNTITTTTRTNFMNEYYRTQIL